MMAYKIMLVMIIFSGVCGGLNTLGWYVTRLPEQQVLLSQAQVTDLTKGAGGVNVNAWTTYTMLKMVFQVIGSCLLALLTIIPFLTAFGVPIAFATMVQIPVWLVLAWAVYEIWTGHSTISQE
jgi:hypothetical protein